MIQMDLIYPPIQLIMNQMDLIYQSNQIHSVDLEWNLVGVDLEHTSSCQQNICSRSNGTCVQRTLHTLS